MTAEGLREKIDKGWDELIDVAQAKGLTTTGSDGWAVKDHLAHVAAWEVSLLALIEGRDRTKAMGIDDLNEENVDEVNRLVFELHREKSPAEALRFFRETHEKLMAALAKLSPADLERPYSHFQPSDPDESRPVLEWVAGNTYEHYAEHIGWIQELAAATR
jgi:DinB family protein